MFAKLLGRFGIRNFTSTNGESGKHLIFLNSELIDGSLLAIKRKLQSIETKNEINFEFYDLSESSLDLVIEQNWITVTVIGNIGDNGRLNGQTESEKLKSFLRKQTSPRLWIMHHDIGNSIKNILYGKKAYSESKVKLWNEIEMPLLDENPREFFDYLAWEWEYAEFNEMQDPKLLEEGSTKAEELEERIRLAKQTLVDLKALFPVRVPFFHTLHKSEIKKPLGIGRYWKFCVVGERYSSRISVERALTELKFKIAPFLQCDKIIRHVSITIILVLSRCGIHKLDIRKYLRRLNQNFIYQTSRFAWVDGGYFGGFVRKFLEAPSKGAVVVCPQMEVAKRLGFRNRINCIFIDLSKVDHEFESLNLLSKHQIRLIQRSARELLLRRHTVDTVIGNFFRVLEIMTSQVAFECSYEDGIFIIELENGIAK